MRDFIVSVHEYDVIAGGVDERGTFAVFDIAAMVIENQRAELFRQFTRVVFRAGIAEQNFQFVLRIILPADGLEAIAEDSARVERGNHKTDFRQIGFSHEAPELVRKQQPPQMFFGPIKSSLNCST